MCVGAWSPWRSLSWFGAISALCPTDFIEEEEERFLLINIKGSWISSEHVRVLFDVLCSVPVKTVDRICGWIINFDKFNLNFVKVTERDRASGIRNLWYFVNLFIIEILWGVKYFENICEWSNEWRRYLWFKVEHQKCLVNLEIMSMIYVAFPKWNPHQRYWMQFTIIKCTYYNYKMKICFVQLKIK